MRTSVTTNNQGKFSFFSHDFSALSITVVKNDTLSFGS
ncbi:hypothetical protein D2M30_0254 [Bacillus amyloliquefaciens]|nr:hypothetical protein D2M30_0254 [Bacillus amyloliquefaciens]